MYAMIKRTLRASETLAIITSRPLKINKGAFIEESSGVLVTFVYLSLPSRLDLKHVSPLPVLYWIDGTSILHNTNCRSFLLSFKLTGGASISCTC